MLGCTVLFGEVRGAEVRAFYEGIMGGVCPCMVDRRCPMLPRGTPTVVLPDPAPVTAPPETLVLIR